MDKNELSCSEDDVTQSTRAEEARSKKRYEELADLLPQIVFEMDLLGNLTYVNRSAYEVMGYTIEDFHRGLNVLQMIVPEEREMARRNISCVLNGEKSGAEYTFQRKDGSRIPVIVHSSVILRDGKPAGLRGFIVDITGQKISEDRMRRLSAAIEQSPSSVMIFDMEGTIVYVNPYFSRITGYAAEDAVGKPLSSLSFANARPEQFNEVMDRIKSGQEWRGEIEYKTSSGKPNWVFAHIFPIKDRNGKITHFIDVEEDVTERKLAEEQLRKLFMALDQSPNSTTITDHEGKITYVNSAFTRLTGARPGDVIGRYKLDFIPEADRARVAEIIESVKSGKDWKSERPYVNKDGEERWVSVHISPLRDPDGKVANLVIIEEDITERKVNEERIKNSLREKEVLLKEVHHRVKNNMQIISSLLNLRLSGIDQEPVRQILAESQSRIRSIALVHERIYMSDDLSKINFDEYLKSLGNQLLVTYRANSGRVRLTIEGDDIYLGVDQAVPCGLIMNELISNSLKHAFPESRHGNIRIRLSSGDHKTIITIEDDGVGMPDGFSLSNAQSMGMQLVLALVEQLEGRIVLDSSRGTMFTITFPAR
ncbi:PAS domain S-box protein [Methanocella arvoryzae]|nr:PAS domain S-box protein [Methanocella arvoryzae]